MKSSDDGDAVEAYASRVLRRAARKGSVAEVTLHNYETRLNAMQLATGHTVEHMLLHPAETHRAILRKSGGVDQTTRSYLTAFLAVFRHTAKLTDAEQACYAQFQALFRLVDKDVQERYSANRPTDRQRDAYMPWADVLALRDALPTDSGDYLVMALYTMIPPVRADFGNVRVLRREPSGADALSGNYLVLRDKYMRVVLNEFKSKSRSLQQYNKVLPTELDAVVRASMAREPRTHLLVSPRTGLPFTRDNTYVVHVHRVFSRVLGKPVSISMMRHIFVNSLDYNTLTSGQKCQLSADMLHSVATNDRYRLMF